MQRSGRIEVNCWLIPHADMDQEQQQQVDTEMQVSNQEVQQVCNLTQTAIHH